MSNAFVNTIVFVSDIKKSKQFYSDLLGIKIKKDLEKIVFFDNHLVLHCAESILNTIFKRSPSVPSMQGNNNILIYFECETLENLENLYHEIKDEVRIISKIETQEWGQKVFRFYDPDGHIVEFGEPLGDSENLYRDSEEPHDSPLPHHAAYGSVLRGSADPWQAQVQGNKRPCDEK